MWTMQNLEDVKSDMSAFHRVDDFTTLPGSVFFPRAERLVHYRGAVRGELINRERQNADAAPNAAYTPREKTTVPESVALAEGQRDGWIERA